jgi:hypothetical protein
MMNDFLSVLQNYPIVIQKQERLPVTFDQSTPPLTQIKQNLRQN